MYKKSELRFEDHVIVSPQRTTLHFPMQERVRPDGFLTFLCSIFTFPDSLLLIHFFAKIHIRQSIPLASLVSDSDSVTLWIVVDLCLTVKRRLVL